MLGEDKEEECWGKIKRKSAGGRERGRVLEEDKEEECWRKIKRKSAGGR